MNAWEWQAGSASGLSGERRRARRHAAAVLRSGESDKAVLRQVTVITGFRTLGSHYVPVAGTRLEGHRHGQRIRWHVAGAP